MCFLAGRCITYHVLYRQHERPAARPESLRIYEAHVGMSSEERCVATYTYFKGTGAVPNTPFFPPASLFFPSIPFSPKFLLLPSTFFLLPALRLDTASCH